MRPIPHAGIDINPNFCDFFVGNTIAPGICMGVPQRKKHGKRGIGVVGAGLMNETMMPE